MATATTQAPWEVGLSADTPLWPNGVKIPIITTTGEPNAGKTLFGLLLDPNVRLADAPCTVRCWDFEGSAESYSTQLNFDWVDASASVEGYALADVFCWWWKDLKSIPAGKYRVLVVDTLDDVMRGSVEYLRANPQIYGRSRRQYEDASSMFLWPDAKSLWKRILYVDARTRCQTVCLNLHLKNEWKGARPTGRRIPEGLDVLMKLATLALWLDRNPTHKGKRAPRVPRGYLRKERLVIFGPNGEDRPILPPTLPEASGDAIRAYCLTPPNYDSLRPEERPIEEQLSDDDKLLLQAGIADANRDTAQAELSKTELMRAAAQAQAQAMAPAVPKSEPTVAPEVKESPDRSAGQNTEGDGQEDYRAKILDHILSMLRELFETKEEARAYLRSHEIAALAEITPQQATRLIADLKERLCAAGGDHPDPNPPRPDPPPKQSDFTAKVEELCDDHQAAQIKSLFQSLGMTIEQAKESLARYNRAKVAELTQGEAGDLLAELRSEETARFMLGNNEEQSKN